MNKTIYKEASATLDYFIIRKGGVFMIMDTVNIEDVVNADLEEDFEEEFIQGFCKLDTVVDLEKLPVPNTKIKKASDAVFFVARILQKMTQECTFAIMLDARLNPIGYCCVGMGTSTFSTVSMAKIAQIALLSNARGIILVHNHPDLTKPELSEIDYRCACAIAQMLRPFDGMCLYDFVIVSHNSKEHYSMIEDISLSNNPTRRKPNTKS